MPKRPVLAFTVLPLVVVYAPLIAAMACLFTLPAPWKWWTCVGALVVGVSVFLMWAQSRRRVIARIRVARGRVCIRCYYSLAGLPSPGTCPECGVPFPEDGHAERWVEVGVLMKSET